MFFLMDLFAVVLPVSAVSLLWHPDALVPGSVHTLLHAVHESLVSVQGIGFDAAIFKKGPKSTDILVTLVHHPKKIRLSVENTANGSRRELVFDVGAHMKQPKKPPLWVEEMRPFEDDPHLFGATVSLNGRVKLKPEPNGFWWYRREDTRAPWGVPEWVEVSHSQGEENLGLLLNWDGTQLVSYRHLFSATEGVMLEVSLLDLKGASARASGKVLIRKSDVQVLSTEKGRGELVDSFKSNLTAGMVPRLSARGDRLFVLVPSPRLPLGSGERRRAHLKVFDVLQDGVHDGLHKVDEVVFFDPTISVSTMTLNFDGSLICVGATDDEGRFFMVEGEPGYFRLKIGSLLYHELAASCGEPALSSWEVAEAWMPEIGKSMDLSPNGRYLFSVYPDRSIGGKKGFIMIFKREGKSSAWLQEAVLLLGSSDDALSTASERDGAGLRLLIAPNGDEVVLLGGNRETEGEIMKHLQSVEGSDDIQQRG